MMWLALIAQQRSVGGGALEGAIRGAIIGGVAGALLGVVMLIARAFKKKDPPPSNPSDESDKVG